VKKLLYWYVLIENYDNGDVNAAIIKNKLADKKPDDFHKKEYKREITGKGYDSKLAADDRVRQELYKRKVA
jgi:hypothetical protein